MAEAPGFTFTAEERYRLLVAIGARGPRRLDPRPHAARRLGHRPGRPRVRPVPVRRQGGGRPARPLPRLHPFLAAERGGRGDDPVKKRALHIARLALAAALLPAAGARAQEPLRLSLSDAIARALSEGTAVRLATLGVQQSENRVAQALAELRPQVVGELVVANEMVNLKTFGFSAPGFPSVVGPFDVVDAHVNVAWQVIDLAARRRYAAARAGVRVSEEERRRNENEVAAAVATLYVALHRSLTRIDEIRADVSLFEKLRQLAFDQQKAGVETRIDTTRADVQLARQRQALLVAEHQRDVAQLALLRPVGGDFGTP